MSVMPSARPSPSTDPNRRQYWMAAIVLVVAILGLTAVSTLFMDSRGKSETLGTPQDRVGARTHAIPQPGEGETPKYASDRGGWEQYLVLAMTMAGMASLAGLAWRSSRRARARRPSNPDRPTASTPHPAGRPNA